MKKYKYKVGENTEEIEMEDIDFLKLTAIDNLTHQIRRLANGR